MYKDILLIMLVLFALAASFSQRLIKAVIYLEIFSLISAVIFIIEGAPDVAIAEAVIATTITFVTIQQYKKVRIFYINLEYDNKKTFIHQFIERSCKQTSLLPLFVNLHKMNMKKHIKRDRGICDVIVTHHGKDVIFYFYGGGQHIKKFREEISAKLHGLESDYNIKLVSRDEEYSKV